MKNFAWVTRNLNHLASSGTLKGMNPEALLQVIVANAASNTFRDSVDLGMYRCLIPDLSKSICCYQIVSNYTKIIQYFWLTRIQNNAFN